MYNIFELYKMLPVCCYGMKTHNKLITKYNAFFSYIIVDDNIDDYSAEELYDKYIKFIDNNTICRTLVEKLCDVEAWIEIYPTISKITQAFSKLDIGYSDGDLNIRRYTQKLIDMLINNGVVQLTLLESYAKIHSDNSFYEHLDEISLRPSIKEKTLNNGSMDCDGFCDVEITVSYDIISNTFVRKDRLRWSENTYDKIVPEYCNVESIKHTIIPCYDCRMGEKCGYSCEI